MLCVITIPLCIATTVLHFVASAKAHRKIAVESWFVLAGLVFFLAYTSMFLYRKSLQLPGFEHRFGFRLFYSIIAYKLLGFTVLTVLNGRGMLELATAPPEVARHILKVSIITMQLVTILAI